MADHEMEDMMILESNRLESFKRIRIEKDLKEKIAKAGFYHCKNDDKKGWIRCFCCGYYVKNWKTVDVSKEHKMNTNCIFIELENKQITIADMYYLIHEHNKIETKMNFEKEIEKYINMIVKVNNLIKN